MPTLLAEALTPIGGSLDLTPFEKWGKDHWSLLAYIETRCVDYGWFIVKGNKHMRTNVKSWQFLRDDPIQVVMDAEHGTRLKDGTVKLGHDDWECVLDFIDQGFLADHDGKELTLENAYIEASLRLSDKGWDYAHNVRKFKGRGGTFGRYDQSVLQGFYDAEKDRRTNIDNRLIKVIAALRGVVEDMHAWREDGEGVIRVDVGGIESLSSTVAQEALELSKIAKELSQ